jgi:RNA polymerase sigma-70 factor (ECF subfamily)
MCYLELSMDPTDALQRVLSGDRQAYTEVVLHYQQPLFGFLGRMGLSQDRAEDIAQETFLRAWLKLAAFDPGRASFATWLYTIARRLALNELASAAGKREVVMPPDHECSAEDAGPPEQLAMAERRRELRAALVRLPVGDRTSLALAYVDGLSLSEIAAIEGSTVGAIKTRLHRARARLADCLRIDDA